MPKNVDGIIRHLSAGRRKKIENRAAQLIAEEMTRQELRRARERTQVDVAKALGITQDSVSRLEQRSDLLLSTLRKYVEALGGSLSLIAEFPDHDPVVLGGVVEERRRVWSASGHDVGERKRPLLQWSGQPRLFLEGRPRLADATGLVRLFSPAGAIHQEGIR